MSIWQSGWRGRGAWSPTIGDEPRDGRRARGRSDGGLGHFISPRQHDPGAERPTSPNRRRGGRVMPEACFQHDDRAAGFALDRLVPQALCLSAGYTKCPARINSAVHFAYPAAPLCESRLARGKE